MSRWASFFDPADQTTIHVVPVDVSRTKVKALPVDIAGKHILSPHCLCGPIYDIRDEPPRLYAHRDRERSEH